MPRSARLDAPGLVHHVMNRGIERRHIFKDDTDRHEFISRLSKLAGGDRVQIYAFCLMPNHFHLLTRTLSMPLSVFMSRLLTGYSVYFNRRHNRAGHLFQNRFKSFVVDDENYLLELIRYIHLNPVRASILDDFSALGSWPFTGHATLMGNIPRVWVSTDEVLLRLSSTAWSARRSLKQFMADGLSMGRRQELRGGGLKRSIEIGHLNMQKKISYDERILGDGEFVDRVLNSLQKASPREQTTSLSRVLSTVASKFNLAPAELRSGSKARSVALARSVVSWIGIKHLGLKAGDIALELNVKPTTVYASVSAKRGEFGSMEINLGNM